MSNGPVMWMMDEGSFLDALRRVADGETPDEVYVECFANAFVNDLTGDDE